MEKIKEKTKQVEINIDKKCFGKFILFNKLNLSIITGDTISLLGRSGIGKTTLLRMIAGLDTDYIGNIIYNNKKIIDTNTEISMVFQSHKILPWLTVKNNLKFINKNITDDEIRSYLVKMGLEYCENNWPNKISGGEKTRVELSVALFKCSKLLLLDEPFSDIDVGTKKKIMSYLKEIQNSNNTTMLMTTHNIDDALIFSDRIIVLGGDPSTLVFDTIVNSEDKNNLKERLIDILGG